MKLNVPWAIVASVVTVTLAAGVKWAGVPVEALLAFIVGAVVPVLKNSSIIEVNTK